MGTVKHFFRVKHKKYMFKNCALRNIVSIKVLQSRQGPIKKIIFKSADNYSFHTVSMFSAEQPAIIVCVSAQIGCPENCSFCAAGSSNFVRNLSSEEIKFQYLLGVESLKNYLMRNHLNLLCIILEGMGEAGQNVHNCLKGFEEAYHELSEKFNRIVFRISSAGNTNYIKSFKHYIKTHAKHFDRVTFQSQLSLHSPFECERRWLMPSVSNKNPLPEIVREYHLLSDYLGSNLICNYMLLNFPRGGCNYSETHLTKIIKLLDPKRVEIKLTSYSETYKGFSSPDETTFESVRDYLIRLGFKAKIKRLLGDDIKSACGMLNYEYE